MNSKKTDPCQLQLLNWGFEAFRVTSSSRYFGREDESLLAVTASRQDMNLDDEPCAA